MDLTKIKFKDHKPYCEAGSGDTVWFEADGVDYYVEKWSTRNSDGTDVYTLAGDRSAGDVFDEVWDEFYTLIEDFLDALLEAERAADIEGAQRKALAGVLEEFNAKGLPLT